MKLIKPSFEILEPNGFKREDIEKHIERIGRTCYKSENLITDTSYEQFVQNMIDRQHYAMLEHGTVYLTIPKDADTNSELLSPIVEIEYNPYTISNFNCLNGSLYITTNYRVIIENKLNNLLEFICSPTEYHDHRITVKFICNRQVSHEFVRHRVFSFAQESTRYCNYTKNKFGNELVFIQPNWTYDSDYDYDVDCTEFTHILDEIESSYFYLINECGWKAQQAATILPNALKTELVMTGFIKDWEHFFDLRALDKTGPAHPQAKELAYPLYKEFINRGYINNTTEF